MTARRTLAGIAVVVLLALAGATVTTTPAGAAAPAQIDPIDKPSKDPRPCHGKNCPTDPPTGAPTPTDTTGAPPASGAASDDPTPHGTAGPGAPGQAASGAPGAPAGGAVRPGGGAPGQPGDAGGGARASDGVAVVGGPGTAARPAAATTPVDSSLPLWPILWGGTALIALVTAGLLVILRDRRIRPDSGSQEPDQGVPSPSGPIRMEWVEPDG